MRSAAIAVNLLILLKRLVRARAGVEVAADLDAVPWDVLEASRRLVRRKEAIEGTEKLRGHFRLHA